MYKSDFLFCFRIHNQISFYIFQIDSYFFLWLTFNMVCVCGGGGDMAKKEKKKDSKPNDLALPYFSFPDGDVCVYVCACAHACMWFISLCEQYQRAGICGEPWSPRSWRDTTHRRKGFNQIWMKWKYKYTLISTNS